MEEILILILKKVATDIGEAVAQKILDSLFGKSTTSPDVVDKLINGLQSSINMLPAKVTNRIEQENYLKVISQAQHNIAHNNIDGLLQYLDDSNADQSYWGVANRLAIDLTGVSANDMEQYRGNVGKINFLTELSSIHQYNVEMSKQINETTEYVQTVTGFAVSLSAAVVTLQHTATLALICISKVKKGDRTYEQCQDRLNNSTTKKYIPYKYDISKDEIIIENGLSYILSPALNYAPRIVIGLDFINFYEKAAYTGTSWLAISSYRYRDNDYRYIQDTHRNLVDPYTDTDDTKNWYLQFLDTTLNHLQIMHYNGSNLIYGKKNALDASGSGSYGIAIANRAHSDQGFEIYKQWIWYITRKNNKWIHRFQCVNEKKFLSTSSGAFRNSIVGDPIAIKDSIDCEWICE